MKKYLPIFLLFCAPIVVSMERSKEDSLDHSSISNYSTVFKNFDEIKELFERVTCGNQPKKEIIQDISKDFNNRIKELETELTTKALTLNQRDQEIEHVRREQRLVVTQLEEFRQRADTLTNQNLSQSQQIVALQNELQQIKKETNYFKTQVMKSKEVGEKYKNFIKDIIEKQIELKTTLTTLTLD